MSRRNKENVPYKSSNNKSIKNRINEQDEQSMLRKFGTRRNKQILNEEDYPNTYISGPVPSIDENIFNADADAVVADTDAVVADAVVADTDAADEIAAVNTETAPLEEDFDLGLDDDEELSSGGKRRKRYGGASRKRKGRKSKKGKKSRKSRKSRKGRKSRK